MAAHRTPSLDHVVEQASLGAVLRVAARLYYQAIPPPYLDERFRTAQGDSGKRLHYIARHLNLEGTPIEGWKLEIGSATATVGPGSR